MDGQALFSFIILKMISFLEEFLILFVFILLGEWFAAKRGYNLFERAWIVTMAVLFVFAFILWSHFGNVWLFFIS